MQIKRVKAHNFLSIGDMEYNFSNKGLVLINGRNEDSKDGSNNSNGAGKCLSGDSIVYDPERKERVTIKQFVEERREWIVGVVNGKVSPVRVTDWHTLGEKPGLRLTNGLNKSITGATTHPIMTPSGTIPMGDLHVGDWVATIRENSENMLAEKETYVDDFWWSIGALIGDGGLSESTSSMTFTNMEDVIFEKVISGINNHFGVSWGSFDKRSKATTGRITGDPMFKKWINEHGLRTKSKDKHIDNRILSLLTRSNAASLLSGIYNTDGSLTFPTSKKGNVNAELEITLASKQLADDISYLWSLLGVPSTVRTRKVKGYEDNTYYRVIVYKHLLYSALAELTLIGSYSEKKEKAMDILLGAVPNNNRDVIPPFFNKELPNCFKKQGVTVEHRTDSQLEKHAFSRTRFQEWSKDTPVSEVGFSSYFWDKVSTIESVGNIQTYDITVDTEEHLYVADDFVVHNSSMVNTMLYALYGNTADGRANDTLINRNAKKDMQVILEFTQDGVDYTITRGRKKNKLELLEGETDLTKSTAKLTQTEIENIIGIDEQLFKSTIFFDGATTEGFPDKTDKQKKELLEGIINLEPYRKAHELTKSDLREVKDNKLRLEGSVQSARANLVRNKETNKQTKERIQMEESSLESNLSALASSEAELNKFSIDYEQEKEKLSESLSQASKGIDTSSLEKEASELRNMVQTHTNTLNVFKQSIVDYDKNYNALAAEYMSKDKMFKEYMEVASGSYTYDDVSAAYDYGRDGHNKDVLANMIPSGADLSVINNFKSELEQLKRRILEERTKRPNDSLIPQYESTVSVANERLQAKERELLSLREQAKSYYTEYSAITNDINALDNKRLMLERDVSEAKFKVERSKENLETLRSYPLLEEESDVEELEAKLESLIETELELNAALVAFSDAGIISHLISTISPALTERTNYYLGRLTGGRIQTEFTTTKKKADGSLSEKLDVVMYVDDAEAEYKSLSRGEKRRTDIALGLALLDVSQEQSPSKTNVMFLDELFESLDGTGAETVTELLQEKVNNPEEAINSIFVVSHQDELKSLFNNTITMVKKNGNSYLEEK